MVEAASVQRPGAHAFTSELLARRSPEVPGVGFLRTSH
ncbi:MAG: hypothetical protein AVDCRST_MAG05-1251 [uncultured Rubrobacteraceae bacterium]|uniref:Uncharacterized protein n=1 Tax=uncultured Rubrobacteraceae bacterium TaxID=349277 RepID=A0A6J4S0U4_9ACTN|nr:MAG: hypothetical protein AVDCRST_MAG05-1251 [uncultured Rubrobacteraceae bacterium]